MNAKYWKGGEGLILTNHDTTDEASVLSMLPLVTAIAEKMELIT